MNVKMKFGSKDIPFVYKGDKLVYPNPIKDGLLLWYDFKGMRNTDTNKEVAKDLSGNGNDGTLQNFNFSELSGYSKNSLLFDGIDDKLQIPDLGLNPASMSVEINGKTYSYDGDKVVSIGEYGEVESGNKNLFVNSDFSRGSSGWTIQTRPVEISNGTLYLGAEDSVSSVYQSKILNGTSDETHTVSILVKGAGRLFVGEGAIGSGRVSHEIKSSETFDWLTFKIQSGGNGNLVIDTGRGSIAEIIKVIAVKGEEDNTFYSPAPQDFTQSILTCSPLRSLQYYNKSLLKNELLHNNGKKELSILKPSIYVQKGLVLHYDFSKESNSGEYKGRAFDYSGNGNHGTLQNFNFTEESGYVGNKLKFDGVDDYITSNNVLSGFSEFVTVEVTISDVEDLVSQTAIGMNYYNFELRILRGGRMLPYYSDGKAEGYNQPNTGTTNLTDGLTHTVAVAWDKVNGITHMYADGAHIKSQTVSPAVGETPEQLRLGSRSINGSIHFSGIYKSAKLYNRILTPEEIAHNYAIEKARFGLE